MSMMRWFEVARTGLRSLGARRAFERQLDDDVAFHIEEATAEFRRAGMSPEEARRAALRAFGNPSDVMEDVREVSMWIWWERLAQDLRYGIRGFRRTPVFAVTAVLSIALGIGAATAIFSVFNAVMLRPLPVHEPGTLFQVLHQGDGGRSSSSTYGLYDHVKRHATTIAGALQVNPTSPGKVLIDGRAESVGTQRVTGEYFDLLGVRPVLGRLIGPADERGEPPNRVAVLGHAYWMRRFGGDPGVLGRVVTVDDAPHTIVGVTAPEFFGMQTGRRTDLTIPLDGTDDRDFWKARGLIVRLAPGVTRDAAVADLNVRFQQYLDSVATVSEPARAKSFKSLDLAPAAAGLPEFRDRYGKPVQAMLAIVGALVLLGCANLASLFLTRAAARQRDLSVCLALGANRARIARQLLSETLVIAAAGGLLGLGAAWWGVNALIALLPDGGAPVDLQVPLDRTVLLFGLLMTMATGLVTGLAPAWLTRRVDIRDMLCAGGRTVALGGTAFKVFVVVQVALSTMIVVAAMLFVVTLGNLRTVPLGFDADRVLTLTVDADGTGLEGERLGEAHRQMLARLQALPGVARASFATIPPLSGNVDGKPIALPGVAFASPDDGVLQVNTVGPDFFETFGVSILRGRGITAADHQSAPQVVVVSESMARHYFPGSDPIGRRMDVGRGRTGGQIEIVGIAADVRYRNLRTPPPRIVYIPAFQREAEEETVFALRAEGDPASWAQAATREIQAVVPTILATDVKTLRIQRDEAMANERLLALLSACLGDFALLLAGLGVYGVVTYSVTQRTRELAVRTALGAQRSALLVLMMRGTLSLVVAAAALGAAAALMTSSFMASFLFGVRPAEPWVYGTAVAVMIGIGVIATIVPTLRALRIDLVETLRWE